MGKTLDFNKTKKEYFTVTLPDEKKTVLMIGTPTKALMDEFMRLANLATELTNGAGDEDTINALYDACASIMSQNKLGIKVTGEKLGGIFDLEDIMLFLAGYTDFISGLVGSKN